MSDKITKPININFPVVPDSLDNAVQNLTDAPTKGMGKTLSDVWYLVFGGITQIADKRRMKYAHELELYHQELQDAISEIPQEKKAEPDIQVTAQALENSKYCVESEELRALFVNLISNSMNNDFTENIHPSFAEIIKQMSPLDAKILKTINPKKPFPLASYRLKDTNSFNYITALSNIYIPPFEYISLEQICTSISSLERLGIIEIVTGSILSDKDFYKPFEETKYYQELSSDPKCLDGSWEARSQHYLGRLTPLGQNFFEVCVK